MAIGVVKNESLVALVEETTEGTEAAVSAGSEFIQVQSDGLEIVPGKELIERTIISSGKGKVQPRVSTKSVTASVPIEFKGSGVEGAAPETDVLYRSLLGGKRQISARITTGTTHTTSLINATAHGLAVGDFVVILESGDHSAHFVASVPDADSFTYSPPRDSAPSDAVEIAKSTTYYADTDEPTFTKHIYWGDEIHERAIGLRAASASFENITTGQTPTVNFSCEGLSFNESDASAGVVPSYDDELPPVALDVVVAVDGVCLDMNELSLTVENTVSPLSSVKSSDGRISSRIAERVVNGALQPYLDDADVSLFTNFNNNTPFELVITMRNESSTAGEFDLGSVCGLYMPNCTITSLTKADLDGVLTRPLEFNANTGSGGSLTEMFVGFC